ncbi:cyclophilin-like fold protein [Solibaculum mannosilyticum]|uniref:Cyclophilin-like domain-containing protein n=1 Tax=Solibaculum mannosilyticum TaxID=2780922 RepID=A0A7I8D419_9FIRM|nr:cyclophilin-like fold protein [Solibaculum mannosilyticum]BCI60775.1 hypothetical protein C12CBH8_14140 [Solibaculum mannosilyticum]CZT57500.1 hypothetical protein BN3661_02029 [Eubacteriaceae bacterium CHKCI005]
MKKIALFILISTFLFGLVGCGSIDNTTMLSSVPEEAAISQSRQEIPSDEQNVNTEEEIMKILVKSEGYEIIYELNDSRAAKELYEQLPLTAEVEPFSNNEMTFYPEMLNTEDTPLSSGKTGSLSYYAPWGDVVMFYAPCTPNNSLYELGTVVSGKENIQSLSGTITVSACE